MPVILSPSALAAARSRLYGAGRRAQQPVTANPDRIEQEAYETRMRELEDEDRAREDAAKAQEKADEEAAREAAKAAKDQAAAQLAAENNTREAAYRRDRRSMYVDANGRVQPVHTDEEWAKIKAEKGRKLQEEKVKKEREARQKTGLDQVAADEAVARENDQVIQRESQRQEIERDEKRRRLKAALDEYEAKLKADDNGELEVALTPAQRQAAQGTVDLAKKRLAELDGQAFERKKTVLEFDQAQDARRATLRKRESAIKSGVLPEEDTAKPALITDPAAFEAARAQHEQEVAAVTAEQAQRQAKMEALQRENARLMSLPHSAADVSPDGQWHRDLLPRVQELGAAEANQAPAMQATQARLTEQARVLQDSATALNAQAAQEQAAAKIKRAESYASLNTLPGNRKLGDRLRLIDQTLEQARASGDQNEFGLQKWAEDETAKIQAEAESAQAQAQKDVDDLWSRFGFMSDAKGRPAQVAMRDWTQPAEAGRSIDENLDTEARKRGLDPKKVREEFETRRRLDFSQPLDEETAAAQAEVTRGLREKLGMADKLDQVRTLPNGDIIPNPELGSDRAAFDAVIDATEGTPEQKAKARALWPRYRELYGESAADVLEAEPDVAGSFHDYRAEKIRKEPGFVSLSRGEQAARYLDNAKSRGSIQKWGQLIRRNLMAGFGDIATAVLGTAGAVTRSETLSNLAAENAQNMQSITASQELVGPKGLVAGVVGQTSRMLPGVAATIGTGGMGAAMAFGGMQTGGLLYADAYGQQREAGATHEEAWKAAAPASALAGGMTAALTNLFPGGVTALNSQAGREALNTAWRTFVQGAKSSGRAIVKGAADEVPQEILDEGFSQMAQGYAEGRSPDEVVREFLTNLPELAIASGLMGAGGELLSSRAERAQSPISPAPRESELTNPDMGSAAAVEPAAAPVEAPASPEDRFTLARGALAGWTGDGLPEKNRAVTQDKAAVLIKIAEGATPADLEQEELMAVGLRREGDGKITPGYLTNKGEWKKGPRPDGFTSVELMDGQFVITDRQVDRLRKVGLEAVAEAIALPAAERRKQIQDKETSVITPTPTDERRTDPRAEEIPADDAAQGRAQTPAEPEGAAARGGQALESPAPAELTEPVSPAATFSPASSPDEDAIPMEWQAGAEVRSEKSEVPPETQQRAQEIAVELSRRGFTAPEAEAMASGIVAEQGIVGGSYVEQMTDPGFEEALKARGWEKEVVGGKTRYRRAMRPVIKVPGKQPATRGLAAADEVLQQAQGNAAPVNPAPAKPDLRELSSREDWRAAREIGLRAEMQKLQKEPDRDKAKAALLALTKADKLLVDLVDNHYGRLFDGVVIGKSPGGLAAQTTARDAQGRASAVVLVLDPANFYAHAGLSEPEIRAALDEELMHRVDQMVSSEAEAIALARAIHAARPGVFDRAWKTYFRLDIANGDRPASPPKELSNADAYMLYFEATRMLHQGTLTTETIEDTGTLRMIYRYVKAWLAHVRREVRKLPKDLLGEWMARIEAAEKLLKKIEKSAIAMDKARLDDVEPPESAVRKPQKSEVRSQKSDEALDDELGAAADEYYKRPAPTFTPAQQALRNLRRIMDDNGEVNIIHRIAVDGGIPIYSDKVLKMRKAEGKVKGGELDWLDRADIPPFWKGVIFRRGAQQKLDPVLDQLWKEGYFPEAAAAEDVTGEMLAAKISDTLARYDALRRGESIDLDEQEGESMSKLEAQRVNFERATASGPLAVRPADLQPGDVMQVKGPDGKLHPVEVLRFESRPLEAGEDYDPQGNPGHRLGRDGPEVIESVTLRDGTTFGVQTIDGQEGLFVDEFNVRGSSPDAAFYASLRNAITGGKLDALDAVQHFMEHEGIAWGDWQTLVPRMQEKLRLPMAGVNKLVGQALKQAGVTLGNARKRDTGAGLFGEDDLAMLGDRYNYGLLEAGNKPIKINDDPTTMSDDELKARADDFAAKLEVLEQPRRALYEKARKAKQKFGTTAAEAEAAEYGRQIDVLYRTYEPFVKEWDQRQFQRKKALREQFEAEKEAALERLKASDDAPLYPLQAAAHERAGWRWWTEAMATGQQSLSRWQKRLTDVVQSLIEAAGTKFLYNTDLENGAAQAMQAELPEGWQSIRDTDQGQISGNSTWGSQVFHARKVAEGRIARAQQRAVAAQITTGQVFKQVWIGGDKFSTVKVVGGLPDGRVEVRMKKQGIGGEYVGTVSAIWFADAVKAQQEQAQQATPEEVDPNQTLLFSPRKRGGTLALFSEDEMNFLGDRNTLGLFEQKKPVSPSPSPQASPSFSLESPTGAELDAEAARKKTREQIQQRQDRPLIGTQGDIGQMDMLGGNDLLSMPVAKSTNPPTLPNAPATPGSLESDRPRNDAGESGRTRRVQPTRRETGFDAGELGTGGNAGQDPRVGGGAAPGGATPDAGSGSAEPVQGEASRVPASPAGSEQSTGSSGIDDTRAAVESGAEIDLSPVAPERPARDEVAAERESTPRQRQLEQAQVQSEPSVWDGFKVADAESIARSVPMLLPQQQQDVLKAERRFFQQEPTAEDPRKGILFTNGTGTGKTFTGLGIIKRFEMMGKGRVLIVVPNQQKVTDWKAEGERVMVKATPLKDTNDIGEGVVVTTYANMRDNWRLQAEPWDLVVYDESHNLSSNAQGTEGANIAAHELATAKPGWNAMKKWIMGEIGPPPAWDDKEATARYENAAEQAWKRIQYRRDTAPETRAVFLSATPFAYHKNLKYADGFLYRSPEVKSTGYNVPQGFDKYLVENFGYSMRTNRLTSPAPEVDVGLMEREWAERQFQNGAMSGRMIDVPYDYSREFILLDSQTGKQLDEGFSSLSGWGEGMTSEQRDRYYELTKAFQAYWYGSSLGYTRRMQFLESIKVADALDRMNEHLDLGRKIVLFHSYNNAEPVHPFQLGYLNLDAEGRQLAQEWMKDHPALVQMNFKRLQNPRALVANAFGSRVRFFNGEEKGKDRAAAIKAFNDDASGVDILMVQMDAGKEGISLHDVTGTGKQRVLMNAALPVKPTDAIQTEGRIYRIGVKSNAIQEYLVLHTAMERSAFGSKISTRTGTVENMALGKMARTLTDSFKSGYLNAHSEVPSAEQGMGGKKQDAAELLGSDMDRAKSYYFGRMKKTSRNKAAEGVDYFATPEPVGLTMVRFLEAKAGMDLLEPSAGHGAIGRFFPDFTANKFVEPSRTLADELRIKVASGKVEMMPFEDLHIVNKFDGVAMNPPFGTAGRLAGEHLHKASRHLRQGGRLVAIIPEGPAMQKRFDAWLEAEGADMHLRASYGLPTVTFERAGTSVKTRIVVLDKADLWTVKREDSGVYAAYDSFGEKRSAYKGDERSVREAAEWQSDFIGWSNQTRIENRSPRELRADTINELFDQLENLEPPTRITKNVATGEVASVPAPEPEPEAMPARPPSPLVNFLQGGRGAVLPVSTPSEAPRPAVTPAPVPEASKPLYEAAQTLHAKRGTMTYVAKFTRRIGDADYSAEKARAKQAGGYYSAFKGNGAIPGFQFESAEKRDAFVAGYQAPQALGSARKRGDTPPAAPFYSKLAQVIEQKMPNRADAATIQGLITNPQTGIKAEELKWSGILPWVEAPASPITKQAVLDYLATDGAVRLEVISTNGTVDPAEAKAWLAERRGQTVEEVEEEYGYADEQDYVSLARDVGMSSQVRGTKYNAYQLPGGENYREVVLAMPVMTAREEYIDGRLTEFQHRETVLDIDLSPEQRAEMRSLLEEQNRLPRPPVYRSSHFPDVPNYVAHMRLNDRTDAEGQAGTFIEEIQSDRHQAGREKGYQGDFPTDVFEEAISNGASEAVGRGHIKRLMERPTGDAASEGWQYLGRYVSKIDLNEVFHDRKNDAVPDAPFRTTWPLQMFKRALADAVAAGKQWIGWTTGETQAERYKFSKQVDGIRWEQKQPGKKNGVAQPLSKVVTINLKQEDELQMAVNDEGTVIAVLSTRMPELKGKPLADVIGKEMAKRILETDTGDLSGDGLKVGGDGMKGFYDTILPKEIGKYVKQWGAGVVKSNLARNPNPKFSAAVRRYEDAQRQFGETSDEALRALTELPNDSGMLQSTPIWRVDITPQMRAGVEAGQALFAAPKRPERGGVGVGGRVGLPSPVDTAAHEAATSPQNDLPDPTPAQKEAGNYAKGHVAIAGHEISIENPAGSKRRPEWPALKDHYGYFKGTNAKDGDHVDVFVKPGTPEDYAGPVHVVRQVKVERSAGTPARKAADKSVRAPVLTATGQFDEYKVMLGYPTAEEARAAYLRNYEPGWPGLQRMTSHSMADFETIKASVFTVPADRVPGVREADKALNAAAKRSESAPPPAGRLRRGWNKTVAAANTADRALLRAVGGQKAATVMDVTGKAVNTVAGFLGKTVPVATASRLARAGSAVMQATGLQKPLAALGSNKFDKWLYTHVFKPLVWDRVGSAQEAVKTWLNKPGLPNGVLKGLVDQALPMWSVPREYLAHYHEAQRKAAWGREKAMDVIRALSHDAKVSDLAYPKEFVEDPIWRVRLFDAMEGKTELTELPEPLQKLAARLRLLLEETGRDLVKQGLLNLDTFNELRENGWMPRYTEEEAQAAGGSWLKAFKLGVKDLMAQRSTAYHVVDTTRKDPRSKDQYAIVSREEGGKKNRWRFRNEQHMNAWYQDFVKREAFNALTGKSAEKDAANALMAELEIDAESLRKQLLFGSKEERQMLASRFKSQGVDVEQVRRMLTSGGSQNAQMVTTLIAALNRDEKKRVREELGKLTFEDLEKPAKLSDALHNVIRRAVELQRLRYKKEKPFEPDKLIKDPVYAVARYVMSQTHNAATMELLRNVAKQRDWVSEVSLDGHTEIPDNPRFGPLAGKFVRADIATQVLEHVGVDGAAMQFYDSMLRKWKAGKLVLNPGSHVRDAVGNTVFAFLGGNSLWNPGNLPFYRDAITALRDGGEAYAELIEQQVLGGDAFTTQVKAGLKGLLPDTKTVEKMDPGAIARLFTGFGAGIRGSYEYLSELRKLPDDFYKTAAYLKYKSQGMSPAEAAAEVRKWFPYYDRLGSSKVWKQGGRFAMPFASFFRESTRILGRAAMERPLALATSLSFAGMVTRYSLMMLGLGDDDEEAIKRSLRGKLKFSETPIFAMLLPSRTEEGQLQQWDISAVMPFADLLGSKVETREGEDTWTRFFRSMFTASPLLSAAWSWSTNTDAFSGRRIVEEDMGVLESTLKRAADLAGDLLPPLTPWVGVHANTLENAGRRTSSLEMRNKYQSYLRAIVGLDVRSADPNLHTETKFFREQNNLPLNNNSNSYTTPLKSRLAKDIKTELIQDAPDIDAIAEAMARLEASGNPVRSGKQMADLLDSLDPAKIIKAEYRRKLINSFSPEALRVYATQQAEFKKAVQRVPNALAEARKRLSYGAKP